MIIRLVCMIKKEVFGIAVSFYEHEGQRFHLYLHQGHLDRSEFGHYS